MMNDPMVMVRKLLISDHGVAEAKVKPDARLLHDLGIDGDDAAQIFQALYLRYGTDFSALNSQWSELFNAEGVSIQAMLLSVPFIIICGGLAGVLVAALHWPKFMAFVLSLLMFFGGRWLYFKWFGRDQRPVTVLGLVQVVRSGRWPADPGEVC